MEKLNFKLEQFEGPLDLLLHLIAKHKLNIHDISIAVLLEQYLESMEQMKLANLEVTSEFLAMAAHLVYIKTVSLLPKHEEAETLKKELEGRLLEYQLCKEIAESLNGKFQGNNIFIRKPQKIKLEKSYLFVHEKSQLLTSYLMAIGKGRRNLPPPQAAFSGIVSRRMISVSSRILFVLKKLYECGEASYAEFFSGDRSEMVATFLALLELVKSKRIFLNEDNSKVYFNRHIPSLEQPSEEEEELEQTYC